MTNSLYVGLMSGTSIDAIDAALIACKNGDITVVECLEHPIPPDIRQRIVALSSPGPNEIEDMGCLDREMGQLFADATLNLLAHAAELPQNIAAIGSHGQTIRHRPRSAGHTGEQSFTLQIGDPNTIAEITGITTVADFRRRDIAAGGEGAPLAPAFHAAAFASAGSDRAIVNIGGIANASVLAGHELLMGFDTGPGNTLMDHWVEQNRGERYDAAGSWAAGGEVDRQLLQKLLQHPYLKISGPRSTGKESFNLNWLCTACPKVDSLNPQNVQATLSEFTAATIAHGLKNNPVNITEAYICGGGAHNADLMQRLARNLEIEKLDTTSALGIHPDWVEAAAFAWLAKQTLQGLAGNSPVVTGAAGARILGGIFPA
jgi:anhydro-N-acetylmuramic acid kinase